MQALMKVAGKWTVDPKGGVTKTPIGPKPMGSLLGAFPQKKKLPKAMTKKRVSLSK